MRLKNTKVYNCVYSGGNGLGTIEPIKLCNVLSSSEYKPPITQDFYDLWKKDETYLAHYQSPNFTTNESYGDYYNWTDDTSVLDMGGIDKTNKLIYSPYMSNWGNVEGDTCVNIIGCEIKGNVYSGANNANVGGDTKLTISYKSTIDGNVIGSGEQSTTSGNSDINIYDSHIKDDVCKKNEDSTVSGKITLNIDAKSIIDGEIK